MTTADKSCLELRRHGKLNRPAGNGGELSKLIPAELGIKHSWQRRGLTMSLDIKAYNSGLKF